jgi:REP element-mobilizing transposase RayT
MTITRRRFKGKYRITSDRLRGWDYGSPGYYFITLCTKNRVPWFGIIRQDQLILSRAGEMAAQELIRIPQIRPSIKLDAWVVMPNHIHAVIVMGENSRVEEETAEVNVDMSGLCVETPRWGASTQSRNWKKGTLGGDYQPV